MLNHDCELERWTLHPKLADAGIISKEGFADELEKAIGEAEVVRDKEAPNLDFSMGRALVKMLRDPNPPRWTPTVIPGGRESDRHPWQYHQYNDSTFSLASLTFQTNSYGAP